MGGSQPAALADVAEAVDGCPRAIPQAFAVRDRHRRLNYSNPPARRSASCQPMIRSTTSSISAAITSLLPSTELAGAKLSRSGPNLQHGLALNS
jgi:hypothetical protein